MIDFALTICDFFNEIVGVFGYEIPDIIALLV
jgi:hypothetical protein